MGSRKKGSAGELQSKTTSKARRTGKFVLFIRQLNDGGAQRQLVELAIGLAERGRKVIVVTFYPGGRFWHRLEDAGISVSTIGKKGRWDVFGFYVRFVRFIRRCNPDVVYAFLGVADIVAILAKPFCGKVRIVWGVRASYVDLRRYGWINRWTYRLECSLSRLADLIIANSQAGRANAIAHGFPPDRTVVIANGINTDQFVPDRSARRAVRAEWGVRDDERLIGIVGRFDPMKDHETFLRAAARLHRNRSDIRFACVGDGPAMYRRSIESLADRFGLGGRVIWAGGRNDMPAVYNALDILTSASAFGEGFPNAVAEAMACGVACVVTNVGDSAMVVGDVGIVVPSADPEALANGWLTLLSRLTAHGSAMSHRARARIVGEFGIDSLVARTSEALECLA